MFKMQMMTSVLSVLLLITLLCVSPSQAIPFGVDADHSSATDVAAVSPVGEPDFTLVETGVTWRNGHIPNRIILNFPQLPDHQIICNHNLFNPQFNTPNAEPRVPKLSLLNKIYIPNLKPNSKIYLKMSIRNPQNSTRHFALVTHSNLNYRSHQLRRQSSTRHVRTLPSIYK